MPTAQIPFPLPDKLVLKNTAVLWLVPLTRCKLFARGNLQVSIGNTAVLIDNLEKTMLNSATKHYLCLWICHIWKALPNIPARVGTSMPSIELSANICDFSDHAFASPSPMGIQCKEVVRHPKALPRQKHLPIVADDGVNFVWTLWSLLEAFLRQTNSRWHHCNTIISLLKHQLLPKNLAMQ